MNRDAIVESFDQSLLPDWAKEHEDVVWLFHINLGYRVKVMDCSPNKDWLIRKAKLVRRGWQRKNPLTEITQI